MELTWKPFGCFLLISTIFAPILGEVTKKAIAGSNEENHHGIHLGLVKDHIYRMVIVEGRCTMARSSSLGANCSLVDTKV